jgi:hypothetical protein
LSNYARRLSIGIKKGRNKNEGQKIKKKVQQENKFKNERRKKLKMGGEKPKKRLEKK